MFKRLQFLSILIICFAILSIAAEGTKPSTDINKLWDFNDPAGTEKRLNDILDDYESNSAIHAEILSQIARSQGMQMKIEEAHTTLHKADAIIKKLDISTDGYKIAKIRYDLEKGRIYHNSGDKEKAKNHFLAAYDFGTEHKIDRYLIDAAHMMGIVEPPEKQLDWNLRAIKITENTDDSELKSWLGPLYNNSAWSFHDLGKYEEALELFQKDVEWRESIGDVNGHRIARWSVARTFRSLERIEEALEIQIGIEQEIAENNLPPDGYVYEELGELHLIKENHDEAKKYFELAYNILSQDKWIQANEPEKLNRLKDMID